MSPGSVIPAHTHEDVAEVLYVIEGDFINEGKRHQPGTSLRSLRPFLRAAYTTEAGTPAFT